MDKPEPKKDNQQNKKPIKSVAEMANAMYATIVKLQSKDKNAR